MIPDDHKKRSISLSHVSLTQSELTFNGAVGKTIHRKFSIKNISKSTLILLVHKREFPQKLRSLTIKHKKWG